MNPIEIRQLSSLTKVFCDRIVGEDCRAETALGGQEVAFQLAYRLVTEKFSHDVFSLETDSPLSDCVTLYRVGDLISEYPAHLYRYDEDYLTRTPGAFPDPFYPIVAGERLLADTGLWRAVWISVRVPAGFPAGEYPVILRLVSAGECVATVTYTVKVLAFDLPAQKLKHTQWFHCDCIADVHGVPVFSEEHWALMEKYVRMAAEHGINVLLTPVLTPPLDTEIGGERPTVQLVQIEKSGEAYTFDFSRLERYAAMAERCGIRYLEINHLFSQWGAFAAPKVVATVDGEERQIFGWETPAAGEAYKAFLEALIPQLIAALERMGFGRERLLFHISDEPKDEQTESYRAALAIVSPLLEGYTVIDALSNYRYYEEDLVRHPVVSLDHLEPFLAHRIEGLWCYYCCSQCEKVPNRFWAMPSRRNRILGVLLYRYHMDGFLQWGFNFYYSHHSLKKLDPYRCTDAERAFQSGDAFVVYPYGDDVIPSLTLKVFAEGLADLRMLELLEQKQGRAATEALLDRLYGKTMTFTDYPREDAFFVRLYEEAEKLLG